MTTDSQTCELCGAKALVKTIQTEQFPYGSGDDAVILTANVPVWSCIKCGESFTGGEAEDLRHEAVCLHLGRLAPKEVWAIRDSYGLTQEQFAELTGFGVASIKRWESAHQIQNLSADRYLRLLRMPQNFRFIQLLNDGMPPLEPSFRTPLSERAISDAKIFRLRRNLEAVA